MILFLAGSALGTGCFLDASPFADATGTTTTSEGGSGGTTSPTTTNPNGGAGGATTTSSSTTDPAGGGGTGGTTTTSMGGGGAGGTTTTDTTTTTGPTSPVSCKDALESGALETSGVITIDPDGSGPEEPIEVYCDQEYAGGGWALVYSSVGTDPGTTTDFWKIPYEMRLETKMEAGAVTPGPEQNYYAGRLYRYGREYRDDVVDTMDVEAKSVLRAKCNGINEATMKFISPMLDTGCLSTDVYFSQFFGGWSAPGNDNDGHPMNCSELYEDVTQHYGSCWAYNLGAGMLYTGGMFVSDFDMGWGPHMINGTILAINVSLAAAQQPTLTTNGELGSLPSRLNRITRYTRW